MKESGDNAKIKEVPYVGCSKKLIDLHPALFQDNSLSKGGVVKARGEVVREHSRSISRPPNMNCRIQSFGWICKKFDVRRTQWVTEMGFGGILHLVSYLHLPRQLALICPFYIVIYPRPLVLISSVFGSFEPLLLLIGVF